MKNKMTKEEVREIFKKIAKEIGKTYGLTIKEIGMDMVEDLVEDYQYHIRPEEIVLQEVHDILENEARLVKSGKIGYQFEDWDEQDYDQDDYES